MYPPEIVVSGGYSPKSAWELVKSFLTAVNGIANNGLREIRPKFTNRGNIEIV
jgi:hypothetical protein